MSLRALLSVAVLSAVAAGAFTNKTSLIVWKPQQLFPVADTVALVSLPMTWPVKPRNSVCNAARNVTPNLDFSILKELLAKPIRLETPKKEDGKTGWYIDVPRYNNTMQLNLKDEPVVQKLPIGNDNWLVKLTKNLAALAAAFLIVGLVTEELMKAMEVGEGDANRSTSSAPQKSQRRISGRQLSPIPEHSSEC